MRRAAALIASLCLALGCDEDDPGPSRVEPAPPPGASSDPFTSLAACEAHLEGRGEAAPRAPRVASWNLRWFPDGGTGGPGGRATDVPHLACVIAALDVDAIAVQEVMLHPRGERAVSALTEALDARTGGRWTARFDDCRRDGRQHVGWLVNEARARVEATTVLDEINPLGGCSHHLRPGLAVYLRFEGGPDLHAVVVHLDSGIDGRDHRHRAQSLEALGPALRRLRPRDDDAIVIGDFNTMGRRRPRVRAPAEIAALDQTIGGLTPALRRLDPSVPCSQYYRGRGSLLDHALVTAAMTEIGGSARAEVHGPCRAHDCRLPRRGRPAALAHLSDHCPIVVTLGGGESD